MTISLVSVTYLHIPSGTQLLQNLQLEPNRRELDVISILTNATAPFFADQDIDDFDENDDPPTHTPPVVTATYVSGHRTLPGPPGKAMHGVHDGVDVRHNV